MVSHADIGTGCGFSSSGLSDSTATAKPRLGVTSDLLLTTPTTRPSMSRTGPPLLPGSTGMASCSIGRPSMLRRPDSTPATTLRFRPCGLPTATTAWPCFIAVESPSSNGVSPLASMRITARSRSRSAAWTAVTS